MTLSVDKNKKFFIWPIFYAFLSALPLYKHNKPKYLVMINNCLPSLWKNPVKVNCRCEDKL